MKIGYNWLKSYVNIDCDLAELCEKLTMAGIEVEGIEQAAGVPDGVVVAKIMERKPHPDSDHMSVCQVLTAAKLFRWFAVPLTATPVKWCRWQRSVQCSTLPKALSRSNAANCGVWNPAA